MAWYPFDAGEFPEPILIYWQSEYSGRTWVKFQQMINFWTIIENLDGKMVIILASMWKI